MNTAVRMRTNPSQNQLETLCHLIQTAKQNRKQAPALQQKKLQLKNLRRKKPRLVLSLLAWMTDSSQITHKTRSF